MVTVEEYLKLTEKPYFEYDAGVLTQKAWATSNHAFAQFQVGSAIMDAAPDWRVAVELTVRLREDRYVIPDVAVLHKDRIQDPYPTEPIPLCVEIVSPEDRFSYLMSKGDEYLAWGVPTVWIIDPDKRRAWELTRANGLREASITLTAGSVSVSLDAVFRGARSTPTPVGVYRAPRPVEI